MSRQWGDVARAATNAMRAESGGGGGRGGFRSAARRSSDRVATRTVFGRARTPQQINDRFGRRAR